MDLLSLALILRKCQDYKIKKLSLLINLRICKILQSWSFLSYFVFFCFLIRSRAIYMDMWNQQKLTFKNPTTTTTTSPKASLSWPETGSTTTSFFQKLDHIRGDTGMTRPRCSIRKRSSYLWIMINGTGQIRNMCSHIFATIPGCTSYTQIFTIQLARRPGLKKRDFILSVF